MAENEPAASDDAPEGEPAPSEPAPTEPASSEPATASPSEAEDGADDDTIFGIKVHNLIFVGMFLGIVLGLVVFNMDHHDTLVLLDGTEVHGSLRVSGDEYVIQLQDHTEQRYLAREVRSEKVVWAKDTGSGQLYDNVIWWSNFFGKTLFISALKMIIAPLILASIIAGIVSLKGLDQLKRIGFKTMGYYVCSTLVAVTIGLVAVLVIRPGYSEAGQTMRKNREADLRARADLYTQDTNAVPYKADGSPTDDYLMWLSEVEAKKAGTGHEAGRFAKLSRARTTSGLEMMKTQLVVPMLTNPFQSLSKRDSLGIISAALLLGIAIVVVGPKAKIVGDFFIGFNEVILRITKWFMKAAPFCVMCIIIELVGTDGPAVFATLAWYCVAVIVGILVHVAFLVAVANGLGRCSPVTLWKGMRDAFLIAFTTRSSAATLPVTMKSATENLGVSPRVANFALPVGATMNMDGTALYEGVAVIFLLQMFSGLVDVPIELTAGAIVVIFVTAVLASVGAAAVPDAGLVTMVLVANAVGLPVYYIPIIFAVDAFLDMFRTTTNVLGDTVGCLVVQRLEGEPLQPLAAPA
jgi:Na+/H+-dicarboxylate symporter